MSVQIRSPLPLVRYRLARAALDLQSFTVTELATMAAVPVNTVYSFLSELGPSVAQESFPTTKPGRPRKIYTLTSQAVERLLAGNFEVARLLQEAGIEASQGPVETGEAQEVGSQESRERRPGMRLESLWDLYLEELKDLYSAEKQILQTLPRMARKAQNEPLRRAFESHVRVTEEQIQRLDGIFANLGKSPRGERSRGMEGLVEEASETMRWDVKPEILDAALVSNAQKIKHYKIAGYGTVRTYAQLLGETEHAELLKRTLEEERSTDERLLHFEEAVLSLKYA
jgi:ferritin-like metal-binding protein YciE